MRLAILAAAGLAAAFAPPAALAQDAGVTETERVVADSATGCRIHDPYPYPGKEIRWSGACRDGFADGRGVLVWSDQGTAEGRAEGMFVLGRLEGEGRVAWADGRRYTGVFRRGLADGWGVFQWPDGQRYEGQWRADSRTGTGTLFFPDGSRYVGRFDRNQPVGGDFVTPDGRRTTAAIDPRGYVGPGAATGNALQSAEMPPSPPPPPPTTPGTLEEWLRER